MNETIKYVVLDTFTLDSNYNALNPDGYILGALETRYSGNSWNQSQISNKLLGPYGVNNPDMCKISELYLCDTDFTNIKTYNSLFKNPTKVDFNLVADISQCVSVSNATLPTSAYDAEPLLTENISVLYDLCFRVIHNMKPYPPAYIALQDMWLKSVDNFPSNFVVCPVYSAQTASFSFAGNNDRKLDIFTTNTIEDPFSATPSRNFNSYKNQYCFRVESPSLAKDSEPIIVFSDAFCPQIEDKDNMVQTFLTNLSQLNTKKAQKVIIPVPIITDGGPIALGKYRQYVSLVSSIFNSYTHSALYHDFKYQLPPFFESQKKYEPIVFTNPLCDQQNVTIYLHTWKPDNENDMYNWIREIYAGEKDDTDIATCYLFNEIFFDCKSLKLLSNLLASILIKGTSLVHTSPEYIKSVDTITDILKSPQVMGSSLSSYQKMASKIKKMNLLPAQAQSVHSTSISTPPDYKKDFTIPDVREKDTKKKINFGIFGSNKKSKNPYHTLEEEWMKR